MQSKYDPFFSRSLEHKPIAQSFFKQHLPADITPLVDFDTFNRIDRTNTDEKLAKRHKDITYEAQMEGEIALLACAEHQSQPDIMMPIRFLYYGVDGIAPYFKEYNKVPFLIQCLFYSGKQAPYPYATRLQDYYGHPERGAQELSLRFYLIDSTQISDQQFLEHGHCAPMELLLKHGRTGNFELEIDAYRDVFQACVAAVGNEYIYTMLQYALKLSNAEAGEKIFHFIKKILVNKKEIIMTYGEKIRQEALQEAKSAIARTMLTRGYNPQEVQELTGVAVNPSQKS